MAYMDVAPAQPNGRAAVLLHGKNFCAATWAASIAVLSQAGYRVVAPDQIGFCKSTKPAHYQFSFHQLAFANTHALLALAHGIGRTIIIGHSTGGMLAIRYGLVYPDDVEQLVLVDPIRASRTLESEGRAVAEHVDAWLPAGAADQRRTASAITSALPIMPGPGIRRMSAGSRCWPASIAGRAATSSRGTRRCFTT